VTGGSALTAFGDAYANPLSGGTYVEALSIYNPRIAPAEAEVVFLFTDGTSSTTHVSLDGHGFVSLRLDKDPAILARPAGTPFSVVVKSPDLLAVSMTHYDKWLNGGWAAAGTQMGFVMPLEG
jgi:hypothetical protein